MSDDLEWLMQHIERLTSKRDALRTQLEAVEAALLAHRQLLAVESGEDLSPDKYRGVPVGEAARAYLKSVDEPCGVTEIAEALERGGLEHNSKKFTSSVYNRLVREAKRGTVFRAHRKWWLKEWRDRLDPDEIDEIDMSKYTANNEGV